MQGEKDMAPIRVVLADDHPPLRAGIRMRLEQERDITVIAEADNGRDALRLVRDLKPHLLVLDMEMPDMTGLDVARQLRESDDTIRILILSAHENDDYRAALRERRGVGLSHQTGISRDDCGRRSRRGAW